MPATTGRPPWTVTLVCGASGVGKSSVAVALAIRYATPLAEADDIVTALMTMTTSEQHPALHYWNTHPEARSFEPERISELHFALAEAVRPAFEAVIADRFAAAVRAVVREGPDEQRIVVNYGTREPDSGERPPRARFSGLVSAEL